MCEHKCQNPPLRSLTYQNPSVKNPRGRFPTIEWACCWCVHDIFIMRLAWNGTVSACYFFFFLPVILTFSQLSTLLLILRIHLNKCINDITKKKVWITVGSHLRCGVNKTLRLPLHILCVTSCLLHTVPRCHASLKVFTICVTTSDGAYFLLCVAGMKGQLIIWLSDQIPQC